MDNQGETALWIGVRCRNPSCLKDFVVKQNGEALILTGAPGMSVSEIESEVGIFMDRLNPILEVLAVLHGAPMGKTPVPANLVHHRCPHCGRFYFYTYADYFTAFEPVPESPKQSS